MQNYYFILRMLAAALAFTAGLLVVLKNAKRWRRDSAEPLPFGARLWREMLVLLLAAITLTYLQAAFRHGPGVSSTVYMPVILALFNYGLWVEYREVRERWRNAQPKEAK